MVIEKQVAALRAQAGLCALIPRCESWIPEPRVLRYVSAAVHSTIAVMANISQTLHEFHETLGMLSVSAPLGI
jgi:hypothetical protein